MPLTPEAKRQLSTTVRALRERLLSDLRGAAESRYRLALPLKQAGLDEAHRHRRERLESWLEERVRSSRPSNAQEHQAARERFFQAAVKEAAATLLNRLVLVRHMEALGLSRPPLVTGGWNSKAYRDLRDFAPALLGDETEGYAFLLQLLFDELALDLPGLFGDVGLTRLFPVPASTLREVVDQLEDPRLASAWTDDTTLGWVYQYWNDPEREALDQKISDGGKIEPHEIAAKTQMFTERYMVEWLLHNSLGLMWLCMCRKHGWKADAEQVLPLLDARRAEWRKKREAGKVPLDALMPIEGALEEHWKYYVPQPIPEDAVAKAPDSVRALKILDPACGSGHFLVIAFDLLAALYREEARHRGETLSEQEIAESILENNLFGVDIDPRAIQIAAAGLFLKARSLAKDARPRHLNLVAPVLHLARLPPEDPALVQLRRELREETGIPEELTNRIVQALAGVDHLGTLLKVDATIEDAIRGLELDFERRQGQGNLFTGFPAQQMKLSLSEAKASVLDKLEQFLARHQGEEELGLRLDGEQLATGVRFIRIVKENTYDLVIGNPPYQGTSRMVDASYIAAKYRRGKENLYAAFLERGLDLAKVDGFSALLTMRGWMFVSQFDELRAHLLNTFDLRTLGDVDRGAFEEVPNEVLAATMTTFRRAAPNAHASIALQPTPLQDKSYDRDRTKRKRAAVLAQVGRFEFKTGDFSVIESQPIVYWWTTDFLARYNQAPKLSSTSPARFGLTTGDNARFVRFWHEVAWTRESPGQPAPSLTDLRQRPWVPFVLGGKGRVWFEELREICRWMCNGLEVKEKCLTQYGTVSKQIRNEDVYFDRGIAFTMIGNSFSARVHRNLSVIGNMGSSVYPKDIPDTLCLMNSATSRFVLESLNPGVHFEVGDVNRLPIFPVQNASDIYAVLDQAFSEHEAAREASVEFRRPRPSPWRYAQEWAQRAVDRPPGEHLPPYAPVYDPPPPAHHVSFALGIALGRFGADGEDVLHEAPSMALPHGLLFLSEASMEDNLAQPACDPLHKAWEQQGAVVGDGDDLRTYLRKSFFAHHQETYKSRPIYFPLSSEKKNFVAWVSIHRWKDDTLQILLADHLLPEKRRLEGELEDLRQAKAQGDKGTQNRAEKRFAEIQKFLKELLVFIDDVTQCAEKGPPPPDAKTPEREQDARFVMDLDDGVMINSAALWKLLDPQWKDPKKWWKELATAQGRKDYDWAHLAARYFPDRVEKKCHEDPSLAVAHHCFWRLHPAKAYAWELRLKDELRPGFTLDEPGSNEARAKFLAEHPNTARDIEATERTRRERRARRDGGGADETEALFEEGAEDGPQRAANE
jgi:hypothetical protein